MELKQLKLNKDVIEKVREGKKPSISNDDKVDLDSLTNYWNNIIDMVEKEVGQKPVAFRLVIEKKE